MIAGTGRVEREMIRSGEMNKFTLWLPNGRRLRTPCGGDCAEDAVIDDALRLAWVSLPDAFNLGRVITVVSGGQSLNCPSRLGFTAGRSQD